MDLIKNTNERLANIEKNYHIQDFPNNVIVEISTFCNISCIQCANSDMGRKKGNMDIDVYKKIVDEIALENPDIKFWFAGFGETLLPKYKLYYMIEYAKKKGLKNVYLNTNGMLLDDEVANFLIDSGLDNIVIGMDAYSKETFEKIRIRANRDTVYNNVLNLKRRMEERNVTKPKIEAQFIVMDENENEAEQFKEFWTQHGILVKIRNRLTWSGKVEKQDNINNQINRIACGWAMSTCPIVWNGDVVNCGCDMNGDNIFGNVIEKSIKEIWNGERKKFVENHLNHNFECLPDMCQNCSDWQVVGTKDFDESGNEYIKVHK